MKWRKKDTSMFFERLSMYLQSGLNIDKALEASLFGLRKKHKETIQIILDSVRHGSSFGRCCEKYSIGSSMVHGLIIHGESAGNLAACLDYAHKLLEREDEFKKKIIGALIYPAIIGFFAITMTFILMKWIMPQISSVLSNMHSDLPVITRVVLAATRILNQHIIAMLVGLLVFAVACRFAFRSSYMKNHFASILNMTPLVGKAVFLYQVTIFLRSLGSLVESGISLNLAYQNLSSSLSFAPLRKKCVTYQASLDRGQNISKLIESFPRQIAAIAPIINSGEVSGHLGEALLRAANILEREIDHFLKKLTSLIEPLMMIGMGLFIGSIALSIMLPIYDVSKSLTH